MNGTIRCDRRYPLGDYKYITLEDILNDIPAKLMLNPKFVGSARFLQLLGFEITYHKYFALKSKILSMKDTEEILKFLEDMKDKELENLHKIINGVSLEENIPQEDTPKLED